MRGGAWDDLPGIALAMVRRSVLHVLCCVCCVCAVCVRVVLCCVLYRVMMRGSFSFFACSYSSRALAFSLSALRLRRREAEVCACVCECAACVSACIECV